MPEVIAPTWADLHAVISDATDRLRVVTPFYSEEGITQVLDHLGPQTFVAVTTKLSPPDWASGVADPIALYYSLEPGVVQRFLDREPGGVSGEGLGTSRWTSMTAHRQSGFSSATGTRSSARRSTRSFARKGPG